MPRRRARNGDALGVPVSCVSTPAHASADHDSMGTHMRTTIDIADALLIEAKQLAAEQRTTLREIFEEGLRAALERRRGQPKFKLRNLAVGGNGLQPPWSEDDWGAIRAASYEGFD